jgi:hypothetical protein
MTISECPFCGIVLDSWQKVREHMNKCKEEEDEE